MIEFQAEVATDDVYAEISLVPEAEVDDVWIAA